MNYASKIIHLTKKGIEITPKIASDSMVVGLRKFLEFLEDKEVYWDYIEIEYKDRRFERPMIV